MCRCVSQCVTVFSLRIRPHCQNYSRYYCNEIRFWLKCFPFSLGFLWFPILECSITCLNFLEHSCFFGGLHIWTPIHALALLLDSLVCYICLVCVFFAKFSHHHTCSFRVSSVISHPSPPFHAHACALSLGVVSVPFS